MVWIVAQPFLASPHLLQISPTKTFVMFRSPDNGSPWGKIPKVWFYTMLWTCRPYDRHGSEISKDKPLTNEKVPLGSRGQGKADVAPKSLVPG